jgi:hypothetical protein
MPRSLPRLVLTAALVLAGAAACSSGTGTPAGNPTNSIPAQGAAGAGPGADGGPGAGSAPAAQATGALPSGPTYPSDAGAYATAGINAWATRNIARLDALEESSGTLHTLYACNGCYNTHFTLTGCSGASGSTYCLFFNQVGDSLRLKVSNAALGQPRAITVGSIWDPIHFPSDDQAYAQEAMDAWQAQNDNRLKLLIAAPTTTSAQITALGASPAGQWTFQRADGAAGSVYEIWQDGSGNTLAFKFLNGPPAPTTGPQSQHRIETVVFQHA